MTEELTLKWGTVKGWDNLSERSQELMAKYMDGAPWCAMADHPTQERIDVLCELIDQLDGEIWNDWEGCKMSPDEAKEYVRVYRR